MDGWSGWRVGVGCMGMGGVCREETGGGGREKGGIEDAGFVLLVAYVKNSSNTINTTS